MLSQNHEKYRIPGYVLREEIGTGSVGTVFVASPEDRDEELFAIKIMPVTPFHDDVFLREIIHGANEIRRLAPRAKIVPIYKTGEINDLFYIVMKYYPEGTLESYFEQENKLANNLKLAISLARSMAEVHHAGLLHGDLKPGNILMDEGKEPFLNDFYRVSQGSNTKKYSFPQGTPRYMSPEQAEGRFINAGSDIYSFGVLCYELLAGRSPYKELPDSIREMITLISNGHIEQPEKFNPELAGPLSAVLRKMMAYSSIDRYTDMAQVVDDLEACLKGEDPSVTYHRSMLQQLRRVFLPS